MSVVIPVLNAAATLPEQLAALAAQEFDGAWEVIIADNGSTDGSQEVARAWSERLPNLRVVDASARPGAAGARNVGAAAARGDALVFCDADDAVRPGWLAACARALEHHDVVAGAIDHRTLNVGHAERWHFNSHVNDAPIGLRFKPYALSANMAVSRRAFAQVGGFAEDLGAVGEDVDLSWRLQLAGFPLHFEPQAVVAYRHRHGLRALWHQHYTYGYADPVLYRRFREQGVPAISPLSAVRAYGLLVTRTWKLLRPDTRGDWLRQAARRAGRLAGSLRHRVWYL